MIMAGIPKSDRQYTIFLDFLVVSTPKSIMLAQIFFEYGAVIMLIHCTL